MNHLDCRVAASNAERHASNCAAGNPFALVAVSDSIERAYVAYFDPRCETRTANRLQAAITLMEMHAP